MLNCVNFILWVLNFAFAKIDTEIPVLPFCSSIAFTGKKVKRLLYSSTDDGGVNADSGDWGERKVKKWDRINKTWQFGEYGINGRRGKKIPSLPLWILSQWIYEHYIHIERKHKRKKESYKEEQNRQDS